MDKIRKLSPPREALREIEEYCLLCGDPTAASVLKILENLKQKEEKKTSKYKFESLG